MVFTLAALPQLLQLATFIQGTVAMVIAATRKGNPDLEAKNPDGSYTITDKMIVDRAVHQTTTGKASADALIDRLKALP